MGFVICYIMFTCIHKPASLSPRNSYIFLLKLSFQAPSTSFLKKNKMKNNIAKTFFSYLGLGLV